MANKQSINEIVDPKAFEQIRLLQTNLLLLNDTMAKTIAQALEMAKATGYKSLGEATTKINNQKNALDLVVQSEKEKIKLDQQLVTAQAKVNAAMDKMPGSLREADNMLKLYSKQLKDLSDVTGKNAQQAEAYRKKIAELNQFMKENTDVVDKQRRNIGNYGSAMEGLGGILTKGIAAVGGFAAATKAAQFIINSTDATADQFKETLSGLKEGLNFLAQSIATFDFSNLLQGLRDAYNEGVRYEQVLDKLEQRDRTLSVQAIRVQDEIAKQAIIFKSTSNTIAERTAAKLKMQELEHNFNLILKKDAVEGYDNEVIHAANRSKLNKDFVRELTENGNAFEKLLEEGDKLNRIEAGNGWKSRLGNLTSARGLMDLLTGSSGKYTKEQENAMFVAAKYSKITDEERDKLRDMAKAVAQTDLALTEFDLKMVRSTNMLERNKDTVEANAAAKERAALAELKRGGSEITGLTPQEVAKRLDAGAKELIKHTQIVNQYEKASQEEMTATAKKGMKQRMDSQKEFAKESAKLQSKVNEEQVQEALKVAEQTRAIYDQAAAAFTELTRGKLEQNSLEQAALDEKYEKDVAGAGNNAKKKKDIEAKYLVEKAALDKKARKMKRDQAIVDRIGAQFSLIIGLASGIAQAYRDFPFPIATVFTVLMSALTAVQQVAIMSAPLPPLAKGRKGGPATFARVGEVGTELIVDPSGAMSLTPPGESLAYLKEGASVIPHHELVSMAKQRAMSADLSVKDGRPGYDMEKIISEVMNRTSRQIVEAVKNIPKTAVKIDRDGISYLVNEAGNQWSYINRNIKS